jgi:ribosomal protein S18 acetylase RimI-like enzyme
MEIRLLEERDAALLANVDRGVFDHVVQPKFALAFLADPRQHIVAAVEGGQVVGFVSALDYIHPDKPPELWVNEVGVASSHRRRGLAKQMLATMFEHARSRGCREAWVLTERSNAVALNLYQAAGGVEPPGEVVMFEFRLDESAEKLRPAEQGTP